MEFREPRIARGRQLVACATFPATSGSRTLGCTKGALLMPEAVSPLESEIRSDTNALLVRWDDGHRSTYTFRYLRGFCPCVPGTERTGRRVFVDVSGARISEIDAVGDYALNIIWRDSAESLHTTGIYSYDVLRELCPCPACAARGGADHPLHQVPSSPDQRT